MTGLDGFLGAEPSTFGLVLLLVFVPAAAATGRAVAWLWAPAAHVVFYAAMLACAHKFFDYALFMGDLVAPGGLAVSFAVLAAVGLAFWRMRHASMMVAQYPWLYERSGPFGWREKAGDVSLASQRESA